MTLVTIGTRKSKLALWQTETVAALLQAQGMSTRIYSMETIGDKVLDTSIAKIGSKGVFTAELEEQLASGRVDIAVHSAKDMQSKLPDGFKIIAFSHREKVNDVLVAADPALDLDINDSSKRLVIGTSSVRRRAFLRHYYPHVELVEMRGNLQTRIRKMQEGVCDAMILAYAGVKRMEYDNLIIKEFSTDEFVPPVGQGCIAIEAASTLDPTKLQLIRECVNDVQSEHCLQAERNFLQTLEGGCSIPAFGYAIVEGEEISLTAGLASLDGKIILRTSEIGRVDEAAEIGRWAGLRILAQGGGQLLKEIRKIQAAE